MAEDLIELWANVVQKVEDGVATDVIARQVRRVLDEKTEDISGFCELLAAALAIACLESATENVVALPGEGTLDQLTDEASQRGRDARKLAALWMALSMEGGAR
jgi:hypothetical protein